MSSTVSNELMELALNSLTEIMKGQQARHIRASFILKAIENLLKGESVVQSLTLAIGIISEYPQNQYNEFVVTYQDLLCLLND